MIPWSVISTPTDVSRLFNSAVRAPLKLQVPFNPDGTIPSFGTRTVFNSYQSLRKRPFLLPLPRSSTRSDGCHWGPQKSVQTKSVVRNNGSRTLSQKGCLFTVQFTLYTNKDTINSFDYSLIHCHLTYSLRNSQWEFLLTRTNRVRVESRCLLITKQIRTTYTNEFLNLLLILFRVRESLNSQSLPTSFSSKILMFISHSS